MYILKVNKNSNVKKSTDGIIALGGIYHSETMVSTHCIFRFIINRKFSKITIITNVTFLIQTIISIVLPTIRLIFIVTIALVVRSDYAIQKIL